jgi:L-seryl-tRNA(Ser) seleniumtransferase
MDSLKTHRRAFMKWVAAAPVFAVIATRGAADKLSAAIWKGSRNDVYRRLGVRPLINCRGTWTYLSGSLQLPEVRRAQDAAAQNFVDMYELARGVSKRLAELSGAEAGMVTAGAAAAMAAATAGCMAGTDPAKVWQLPDTTGMKNEVVMLGGRNAFDSAIRLTGARLVVARTHEELERSLHDRTAMVYTTWLGERLEQALAITKKAGVPLLLDDAAGIPPVENVKLYAKMGVDLYCFSGGKGLWGPQCSGLLFGRKDLIEAALANYSPWEGAICRPMKVGKEEVIGVLTALETWMKMDLEKFYREWGKRVDRIAKLVETVPGVTTEVTIPKGGNRYPTLTVQWDEEAFGLTVEECDKQLRDGDPRIEVLTAANPSLVPAVHEEGPKDPKSGGRRPNRLQIVSSTIQEGEELIVGQRLREILSQARKRTSRRRAPERVIAA